MALLTDKENPMEEYARASSDRQKYVNQVLASDSHKKVVVAGPGTGKTYLFKKLLENRTKSLTLTFINALVEDLALELYGVSDVKTLHSFARSSLGQSTGRQIKIHPNLSSVIREDASILLGRDIDFDRIFNNLGDEEEDIEFYKRRKKYYDDHYGYSDIVYAAVKYFELNPKKIPKFQQVVVDEFQDFNELEVALIELLSQCSPILIVGDDDQALYEFKSASPAHIRYRHAEGNEDYDSFALPYCSRCTQVIVDATNDIIDAATGAGLLEGRISKPFLYFPNEKKDRESKKNPLIAYVQIHESQIPWFIEKEICAIAETEAGAFSVLTISPINKKVWLIADGLRRKGFENVDSVGSKETNQSTMLDGLKLLLKDKDGNLGWRVVSPEIMEPDKFEALIRTSDEDREKRFVDLVDQRDKKQVRGLLTVLRKLKRGEKCSREDLAEIFKLAKIYPQNLATNALMDELSNISSRFPAVKNIPIKATTTQRSKGLAKDYVFLTHIDDAYWIRDKDQISDQDVCNFLVALTRAKRKVFLVSTDKSGGKEPTILNWISPQRIERLKVD